MSNQQPMPVWSSSIQDHVSFFLVLVITYDIRCPNMLSVVVKDLSHRQVSATLAEGSPVGIYLAGKS